MHFKGTYYICLTAYIKILSKKAKRNRKNTNQITVKVFGNKAS